MSPTGEKLAPGARLDGYQIVELLGYGAFSDVYLAVAGGGREVVLKCLHEVMLGDTGTFDRFRREMRIAGQLHHPGIQRSLDNEAARSRPYLVLEYVAGNTLRQVLGERRSLPVDQAVDIAVELADAMAYAHGHGVVHRDLKPENVLVEVGGRVVVTDFGIALMAGARRMTWRWFSSEMGTPDYMAPEQIQGKRGDARTDVYALGVILYEMLAGRLPWGAKGALSVLSQKLVDAPDDLKDVAPQVPAEVALIVRRCTRRGPLERYQSAAELGADLTDWPRLDRSTFVFAAEKAMKGHSESALWLLIAGISSGFLIITAALVIGYHGLAAHP